MTAPNLLADEQARQLSISRRFQTLVSGTQVKPMGKGTHFLPMEYPDLVVNEARNFCFWAPTD